MARINRPWFRHDRQRWYVTMNGTQAALPVTDPTDADGAMAAMIDLMIKQRSGPVIKPGTIDELVKQFLESCRRKGAQAKTIRSYASYLKWFVAGLGNRAICAIEPEELTAMAAETAWSTTTQHNTISTCNSFIRWCGRKEFSAPCPPKEARGGESVISQEGYEKLIRESRGDFQDLIKVL